MTQNVLVTPTLLNSYEFAKNAPPSWKERALNDFIAKIKREKATFPAWVKKGIAFEDEVYRVCNAHEEEKIGGITVGSKHFQEVANACLGGSFQDVFKKTIEIKKLPVLFYSKTDVVFYDKIIDIKTTLKWKGPEKYLKGWQHILYLWASGLKAFDYIVAVWENEKSNKIRAIHTVPFTPTYELEEPIIKGTEEMFDFIKEMNLWEDYFYVFSNNRRY